MSGSSIVVSKNIIFFKFDDGIDITAEDYCRFLNQSFLNGTCLNHKALNNDFHILYSWLLPTFQRPLTEIHMKMKNSVWRKISGKQKNASNDMRVETIEMIRKWMNESDKILRSPS